MEHNSATVRQALKEISELRRNNLQDETIRAYDTLIEQLENTSGEQELLADVCLKSAKFLFQTGLYDACLDRLLQAQQSGLETARIAEFIPLLLGAESLRAARENYERQTAPLTAKNHRGALPRFEDLKLFFVPTANGAYLLFDRERGFVESPMFNSHTAADTGFSDYLIVASWDFNPILPFLAEAGKNGKNAYVLTDDPARFFSFLQLPLRDGCLNNATVFTSATDLADALLESGRYLPWHIVAGSDEEVKTNYDFLMEIHRKRLNRNCRRGDNILLTIAIPSFNRGHRAMEGVKRCLQARFDEEIEILVSDNASDLFQEEYRQIAALSDSRVSYYRSETNTGFFGNIVRVNDLAKGRFALLISDEDQLNVSTLDALLSLLRGQQDSLAWLRTSIEGIQNAKYNDARLKRGSEAVTKGILRNNYLTGTVYNTAMFKRHGIAGYLYDRPANEACRFYPHLVIDILLTQYGDVAFSSLISCYEGIDETDAPVSDLTRYQSGAGRLDQHDAFFEIFVDIIREHHLDMATAAKMLIALTRKTAFLLRTNNFGQQNENTVRNYFDNLMELYHHVVGIDLKIYREEFGFELSDPYRDEIRTIFFSLIRDIKP